MLIDHVGQGPGETRPCAIWGWPVRRSGAGCAAIAGGGERAGETWAVPDDYVTAIVRPARRQRRLGRPPAPRCWSLLEAQQNERRIARPPAADRPPRAGAPRPAASPGVTNDVGYVITAQGPVIMAIFCEKPRRIPHEGRTDHRLHRAGRCSPNDHASRRSPPAEGAVSPSTTRPKERAADCSTMSRGQLALGPRAPADLRLTKRHADGEGRFSTPRFCRTPRCPEPRAPLRFSQVRQSPCPTDDADIALRAGPPHLSHWIATRRADQPAADRDLPAADRGRSIPACFCFRDGPPRTAPLAQGRRGPTGRLAAGTPSRAVARHFLTA